MIARPSVKILIGQVLNRAARNIEFVTFNETPQIASFVKATDFNDAIKKSVTAGLRKGKK